MKTLLTLALGLSLSGAVLAADGCGENWKKSKDGYCAPAQTLEQLFESHSKGGVDALFEAHNQMDENGKIKDEVKAKAKKGQGKTVFTLVLVYPGMPQVFLQGGFINFETMSDCLRARYDLERVSGPGQIPPRAQCIRQVLAK